MSENEKQELQNKIIELENYVKNAKEDIENAERNIENTKENIKKCEKVIEALKDIAWDRQSKKESSSMFKILNDEKTHTSVKSNIGDILVDKDFMEKQIEKHLDNPNLRGMVTSQEMLSFPKVAKNVEAEYNEEINDYTWKVKANDESILTYGSREYVKDGKEINRLLTIHSKTGRGQRQADRVSSATYFNDPDFRGSAHNENITQNKIISQDYTWKVKANDGNIINYGERDYGEGHRLLTAHSRTERGERGQPHREFNDRNFHNSANETSITQNQIQSQAMNKLDEAISKLDEAMAEQSARVSKPKPNYEKQKNIETNNENLEKHRKRNTK